MDHWGCLRDEKMPTGMFTRGKSEESDVRFVVARRKLRESHPLCVPDTTPCKHIAYMTLWIWLKEAEHAARPE